MKEVATTWGYLTDGEPIDVVLAYAGQAVTIYPKYLEVENIRQNVIFKVLKEAVTKNGNKPANDVYFGLYNAQSIYASADEAWIVMPRSNFIIKKGETVTLDIGLSSLIADEQVKGFVSTRTGKKFDAKLVLDDNKETRFEFAQQTAKRR